MFMMVYHYLQLQYFLFFRKMFMPYYCLSFIFIFFIMVIFYFFLSYFLR